MKLRMQLGSGGLHRGQDRWETSARLLIWIAALPTKKAMPNQAKLPSRRPAHEADEMCQIIVCSLIRGSVSRAEVAAADAQQRGMGASAETAVFCEIS